MAVKLAYAKYPSCSRNLSFGHFWRIANTVPSKDKSAILALFNASKKLSSVADKTKLFARIFYKKSSFMT